MQVEAPDAVQGLLRLGEDRPTFHKRTSGGTANPSSLLSDNWAGHVDVVAARTVVAHRATKPAQEAAHTDRMSDLSAA